ncbi:zinc metallopeptidase [Clostridium sp. CM028]|uniref:zinc metallopeptidase n=1 Tax=unclassified Clostridium TaxID=2614128 RepID=UPI001C0D7678|nr:MULTISPECIES: zinc metallopeptidase [unclassified Clostridium]MBU3091596.1 zinc metallopeptidase [Clostridium sp. CF011]MBW9144139.1 zinc metallopeptidase [Clostridium sp. CM027]MBW9147550.1 zinc metallopeptidase [Clostridium sp. CM028]UVE41218.1 zinc metallopeptidase [Clostridium sp. CM027]WAG70214.1 zinc metallopeptidase [Clostridium sp. CF011]
MLFYDNTMVVLLPAIIISGLAQLKIKSSFSKYSKVNSANGYTGEKVARMLLDDGGLFDIPVEIVGGKLTDHYDPSKRVMRLSKEVYNGTTVAAIGVAAHETGHALQDKEKYAPLKIRNAIVPAVNFSSNVSWLLFLIGIILSVPSLVNIGIILFSAVVVFQLITLPVEFNASSRALTILESKSILYGDEIKGAKAVLSAAAMTYVAATLMAVSQLIRLVLLSRDR